MAKQASLPALLLISELHASRHNRLSVNSENGRRTVVSKGADQPKAERAESVFCSKLQKRARRNIVTYGSGGHL